MGNSDVSKLPAPVARALKKVMESARRELAEKSMPRKAPSLSVCPDP